MFRGTLQGQRLGKIDLVLLTEFRGRNLFKFMLKRSGYGRIESVEVIVVWRCDRAIMPTVSASGRKLKLAWINAEKTRRAINKMAMPESIASFNSPKGWTNEAVMLSYLQEVIIAHTKWQKYALILDDFGAHWTPKVKKQLPRGASNSSKSARTWRPFFSHSTFLSTHLSSSREKKNAETS